MNMAAMNMATGQIATAYPINLFIAKEDLKSTYRQPRVGLQRIRAYVKSIEKMEALEGSIMIGIEKLDRSDTYTIQFTINGESKDDKRNVKKYIQGAFCNENALRKYEEPQLPAKNIREVRGTKEAQIGLSDSEQKNLQAEGKTSLLTVENLEKHDIKHMMGPCELRQFGCRKCPYSWWRTVLKSKPVSRCAKCRTRYDALPRNKEHGIGRYHCPNPSCGRKFYAKCEATLILRCRKCKTLASNPYIHPKWVKSRPINKPLNPRAREFKPSVPSPSRRNEPGPVFVPESQAYNDTLPPEFLYQFEAMGGPMPTTNPPPTQPSQPPAGKQKHRARGKRKFFNASEVHQPEGGTLSTFITQRDETEGEEVPLDHSSDDEGVGSCRFECDCGNKYTVTCELEEDTAKCYECGRVNPPMGWARVNLAEPSTETENKHSCSKCEGKGSKYECPNLRGRRPFGAR